MPRRTVPIKEGGATASLHLSQPCSRELSRVHAVESILPRRNGNQKVGRALRARLSLRRSNLPRAERTAHLRTEFIRLSRIDSFEPRINTKSHGCSEQAMPVREIPRWSPFGGVSDFQWWLVLCSVSVSIRGFLLHSWGRAEGPITGADVLVARPEVEVHRLVLLSALDSISTAQILRYSFFRYIQNSSSHITPSVAAPCSRGS